MPCFHPRKALLDWDDSEKKYKVRFLSSLGQYTSEHPFNRFVDIPCGKCIGCLEMRAKEWAKRCQLEARYYPGTTYFLTLTYDDDFLDFVPAFSKIDPDCCSLVPTLRKVHFIKFIRSLRYDRHYPQVGLRFFGCGEYGPTFGRPHYHMILFNLKLPTDPESPADLQPILGQEGYFKSSFIENHWKFGFHSIFPYEYATGKYIAKYLVKDSWTPNNDVVDEREKPFLHMSRNPGIGRMYFEDHKEELLKYDSIAIPSENGAFFTSMPDYYLRLIRGNDFDEYSMSDWLTLKTIRSYRNECDRDSLLCGNDIDYGSYLKRAEEVALAQKRARKNL